MSRSLWVVEIVGQHQDNLHQRMMKPANINTQENPDSVKTTGMHPLHEGITKRPLALDVHGEHEYK